jgi:hypothetical protein
MPDQERKLSEIMKEMAEILLRLCGEVTYVAVEAIRTTLAASDHSKLSAQGHTAP